MQPVDMTRTMQIRRAFRKSGPSVAHARQSGPPGAPARDAGRTDPGSRVRGSRATRVRRRKWNVGQDTETTWARVVMVTRTCSAIRGPGVPAAWCRTFFRGRLVSQRHRRDRQHPGNGVPARPGAGIEFPRVGAAQRVPRSFFAMAAADLYHVLRVAICHRTGEERHLVLQRLAGWFEPNHPPRNFKKARVRPFRGHGCPPFRFHPDSGVSDRNIAHARGASLAVLPITRRSSVCLSIAHRHLEAK